MTSGCLISNRKFLAKPPEKIQQVLEHLLEHLLEQLLQQGLFVCLFVILFVQIPATHAGFGAPFRRLVQPIMNGKKEIPLRFEVSIEEVLWQPPRNRWHAQFKFYPLGYFRGRGPCPGTALRQAWKQFRREVDRGRWWAVVLDSAPPVRY